MKRRMQRCLAPVVIVLVAAGAERLDEISGRRIRAHVQFLSSDLLEGRGVGARGGQLAEQYLASQLAVAGLKPGGENGTWYQTVRLIGVQTLPSSRLMAEKDGQTLELRWQQDFVGATHRQREQEEWEAEAVFVGHGIVAPQENWNDYKTSVKGKLVVLFTNEPQPDNPKVFKGRALTYAGRWTYKFEEALRQGALGALIIHTTETAGYGWEVVRNSWSKEDPQVPLEGQSALQFAGWVTQEAGERLLKMAGYSVPQLLKAADERSFRPIPLGIRFRGSFQARLRSIESRNVLGLVEGSDAQRKSQYVIYSAHWDHLGRAVAVGGDDIYNGAIDNATGCGIVLETARAWAALERKPRRSAVFLFFTAEEAGLRGSEYYARHPLYPPGRTAMNINYDALYPWGRTRDLILLGAERTTAWKTLQQAAARMGLRLSSDPAPEQGSYYRSDHFMLARAGIPAFIVKMGVEFEGKPAGWGQELFRKYNSQHYHQPSDEFDENWDFSGLEQAARFGFLAGRLIADQDQLPGWQKGDEFAPARAASVKAVAR